MITQMSLFNDELQIYKQRNLFEEFIDLKAKEIYGREFHYVYGTVEKLKAKREIANYTSAAVDNQIATALYEKFGFEKKEVFEYEAGGRKHKEFRMIVQL